MSMQELQARIDELETLQKSLADPGEAVGGGDPGAGDGGGSALRLYDENGQEVEFEDGAALVKSLQDRLDHEGALTGRAVGGLFDLTKSLAAKVTSLETRLARFENAGGGRRSVVAEQTDELRKSLANGGEPLGMSGREFMMKALDAQKLGRITPIEVSICETQINKGQLPPEHLRRAVLQ